MRKRAGLAKAALMLAAAVTPAGVAAADCAELKQVVAKLEAPRPLTEAFPLATGWLHRDVALAGEWYWTASTIAVWSMGQSAGRTRNT